MVPKHPRRRITVSNCGVLLFISLWVLGFELRFMPGKHFYLVSYLTA